MTVAGVPLACTEGAPSTAGAPRDPSRNRFAETRIPS